MNVKNNNYNFANPSELIHKYSKDEEIISDLDSRKSDILSSLHLSFLNNSPLFTRLIYQICCYQNGFKTLGEEYAYLTHFNDKQSIFIWRKTKLLFFLLRSFGPFLFPKSVQQIS